MKLDNDNVDDECQVNKYSNWMRMNTLARTRAWGDVNSFGIRLQSKAKLRNLFWQHAQAQGPDSLSPSLIWPDPLYPIPIHKSYGNLRENIAIGRQWARGAYIVEREKLLDKILILIDAMQIISSGVCVFVQPPHSAAINLFYFYCCSSSRTFCWLEVSQVIADGFISSSYNIFLKFITIVNRHCHCHCELWLIVSSFRLTQKSETHQSALKPQRISLLI